MSGEHFHIHVLLYMYIYCNSDVSPGLLPQTAHLHFLFTSKTVYLSRGHFCLYRQNPLENDSIKKLYSDRSEIFMYKSIALAGTVLPLLYSVWLLLHLWNLTTGRQWYMQTISANEGYKQIQPHRAKPRGSFYSNLLVTGYFIFKSQPLRRRAGGHGKTCLVNNDFLPC